MRLSVEVIPRSHDALTAQLEELATLSRVDTVNVPDITRFPLRSWSVCARIRAHGVRVIPHLRAIDVDPRSELAYLGALDEAEVEEVLVVSGDAPADMRHAVFDTTTEHLVRRLKRDRPGTVVHVALDPYRQDFASERAYLDRKLEAGADGVFTQPFFDLRLVGVWGDLLANVGVPVFWGATSVTSEKSARYWTRRNRAVLPVGFEPTLAHSAAFARELVAHARQRGDHVYLMPIRASIAAYVGAVLPGS